MASYKNVQKGRQQKDSHFSYTTEKMTSLTHPRHPPSHGGRPDSNRQDVRSVLSVRPDQEPVTRRVPGDPDTGDDVPDSQSSDVNIPSDALSKLQEIIEAQKAFLKYQEIRDILSRQENKRTVSKSRKSKKVSDLNDQQDSDISKSISLNILSDSDKENSKTSKPSQSQSVR